MGNQYQLFIFFSLTQETRIINNLMKEYKKQLVEHPWLCLHAPENPEFDTFYSKNTLLNESTRDSSYFPN